MRLSGITENPVPDIIKILADPKWSLTCLCIIWGLIIGRIVLSNKKPSYSAHIKSIYARLMVYTLTGLTMTLMAMGYTQLHSQCLVYQGQADVVKVSQAKHVKLKQYPSQITPTEKATIREVTVRQGDQTYTSKQRAENVSHLKPGDKIMLQYKEGIRQGQTLKNHVNLNDIKDKDNIELKPSRTK